MVKYIDFCCLKAAQELSRCLNKNIRFVMNNSLKLSPHLIKTKKCPIVLLHHTQISYCCLNGFVVTMLVIVPLSCFVCTTTAGNCPDIQLKLSDLLPRTRVEVVLSSY